MCIYRPPNVHMNYFIENYNTFLEKKKDKKVFICGDFNIDIMKSEVDYNTNRFIRSGVFFWSVSAYCETHQNYK